MQTVCLLSVANIWTGDSLVSNVYNRERVLVSEGNGIKTTELTTERNYFEIQLECLFREERLKVGRDWFDSINSQDGEVSCFYLHSPKNESCSTAQKIWVFWSPQALALIGSVNIFT